VVDVARARAAEVSFDTVQLGALANAVVKVTVQEVPADPITVTFPALSFPASVCVPVPHELAEVSVTAGVRVEVNDRLAPVR
jgi:hypothetical protein